MTQIMFLFYARRRVRLYNTIADPSENNDISEKNPQVTCTVHMFNHSKILILKNSGLVKSYIVFAYFTTSCDFRSQLYKSNLKELSFCQEILFSYPSLRFNVKDLRYFKL